MLPSTRRTPACFLLSQTAACSRERCWLKKVGARLRSAEMRERSPANLIERMKFKSEEPITKAARSKLCAIVKWFTCGEESFNTSTIWDESRNRDTKSRRNMKRRQLHAHGPERLLLGCIFSRSSHTISYLIHNLCLHLTRWVNITVSPSTSSLLQPSVSSLLMSRSVTPHGPGRVEQNGRSQQEARYDDLNVLR